MKRLQFVQQFVAQASRIDHEYRDCTGGYGRWVWGRGGGDGCFEYCDCVYSSSLSVYPSSLLPTMISIVARVFNQSIKEDDDDEETKEQETTRQVEYDVVCSDTCIELYARGLRWQEGEEDGVRHLQQAFLLTLQTKFPQGCWTSTPHLFFNWLCAIIFKLFHVYSPSAFKQGSSAKKIQQDLCIRWT